MRALAVLLLLCIAWSPQALAQSFKSAQQDIDKRLSSSLRELAGVRDAIAKEKIPLSRSVSTLESQVLERRRELERLVKIRDSRTIDLTSLRKQVESLREQDAFVNSRLNEFVRDFESRLDISELPQYETLTAAARLADKNANLDAAQRRATQIEVIKAALRRQRDQLGGRIYAGAALGPDGVLSQGKFVAFGPTVFYASADGAVKGLVENQLNAADAVVVALPAGQDAGLPDVAAAGAGVLPFDATLGKALKVEKARKGLGQYVDEGGVVGYVIIVLGAAALVLTAYKAVEILRFPVAEPDEVQTVLGDLGRGDLGSAEAHARSVEGISGEMLATGVQHAGQKRGILEELLFEKILRVRPYLERYLPFLAITAASAPLLGLLGTVIGMIRTFQLITIFGTGDAKSLSSGISEALITTALGLIVAIPTLVLHGALSRMAKRKLGMLEELSVSLVNGVAALQDGEPGP